jgi:acylphosphatase
MDKRVIIEGARIHGVGFRPFLYAKARMLRLTGFAAENVFLNGTEAIDVSFGGDEKAVREFLEYSRTARPQEAAVSRVREEEPPESILPIDEYDRILASEQQSKIVRTGLSMLKKHDQAIELQKETTGLLKDNTAKLDSFHKDTIQRFDTVDAKYGKIAQNLERILEEMKEERHEARKSTERIIYMITSMKSEGVIRERKAVYGASKKTKKS